MEQPLSNKSENKIVLAAVPISFKRPDDYTNVLRMEERGLKTLRKSTKTVYNSSLITLKLPEDCINYILKMDELTRSTIEEQMTLETKNERHLSLFERLEGWRIEKRKRKNDVLDKFYHHEKSRKKFRSLIQVERFVKYGLYPQRRQLPEDEKSKEDSLANRQCEELSQTASLKRKIMTPWSCNGNTKLNIFSTQKDSICSSVNCKEKTPQMIEEMVDELLDAENIISSNIFDDTRRHKFSIFADTEKSRIPSDRERESSTNSFRNSAPPNSNKDLANDDTQTSRRLFYANLEVFLFENPVERDFIW